MPEPREVRVVCKRCKGSGKDPEYGSGGTDYRGAMQHTPWPCQSFHGGCAGKCYKEATLAPGEYERLTALTPLQQARIAHSEACEAESDAWDTYSEHLESSGLVADPTHPLRKAWADWQHKRLKALDEVRRAVRMAGTPTPTQDNAR